LELELEGKEDMTFWFSSFSQNLIATRAKSNVHW
jgi:hypothetical protein